MFIYMYLAPGQGQNNPWGQFLFQNHYSLHLSISVEVFPFNDILTPFCNMWPTLTLPYLSRSSQVAIYKHTVVL